MKKLLLAGAALALGTSNVLAAPAHAATSISPAYEADTVGSLSDGRNFTLGFEFSLNSDVVVDALAYTTVGFTQAQQVGLWDMGGTLLASTTIDPTGMTQGNFVWNSVSPLALTAGNYYLGGTYTGGIFASSATGVTTAPEYTWITNRFASGAGLNFPSSGASTGTYGPNGIPQVNFSFTSGAVPEPGTWAMMLLGFFGLGAAMRRKPATATRVRFA